MISFVITTYKRPNELRKSLAAILSLSLERSFEIVVSDDGTKKSDLDFLKTLENVRLITTKNNSGLAANINKGIRAAQGDYIVYLQDDWTLLPGFINYLDELLGLLKESHLEMIRLTSNVSFQKLLTISKHVALIPRFHLKNIPNYRWRYSDHPYIVKRAFFEDFGFYKEHTSTLYGETEYSIRMLKLNPKIGIVNPYLARETKNQISVRDDSMLNLRNKKRQRGRKWIQKFGWIRFEFEAALYNVKKRSLLTYTNYRKT